MVESVIFDVDGTLVDSVDLHARAWQEAMRHFGKDVPFEAVRGQIGKGGDQLMPVFFSERELHRFGADLEAFRKDLYMRRYLPQVRAFPRVRALFERLLRDGKRIALASSAKGDELATYKRLAHIEDLVDAETSSDDAERSKPHPDIFQAALARLGHPRPNTVIVVGDTPYDVQAARRAHVACVGLLSGGFPADSLWQAGAVELYRDASELLERYARSALVTGGEGAALGAPPGA